MKREDSAPAAVAFIGDVHLDEGDDEVSAFVDCLDRLALARRRIVLMGDLFNLWVAQPEFERAHHRVVVEKLRDLRTRGTVVRYLEGNRDYRIAARYAGTAFEDSTEDGIVEQFGGHRAFAVHGDLANPGDRQYRAWRGFSRSRGFWRCINMVPRGQRRRLAEYLERRMRGTNLDYKREFPEAEVREYAAGFFASGYDLLILGHFHVEKELRVKAPGDEVANRRILVLPEWKGSRRHLEIASDGTVAFVPPPG